MPSTILLTGATGLIGFRILQQALIEGHTVHFVARSESKARLVLENPVTKRHGPKTRLVPFVIPDGTVNGAYDSALKGVTHIIHTGSPVPYPNIDPLTQVFEPNVQLSATILASALRTPSVKRVLITNSIVANVDIGSIPEDVVFSASTHMALPDPIPSTFDNVNEAYIVSKIVERHNTEEFLRTKSPHFTVSYIFPGYVYGRNDLALSPEMMLEQNSSNNFMTAVMVGGELPFPLLNGFVHVDDLAELHLRVAFDAEAKQIGVAYPADYASLFNYIEKAYPKAVAEGIFKKGIIHPAFLTYDSSDAEKIMKGSRSFESAIVDIAGQYLEVLGKEKA